MLVLHNHKNGNNYLVAKKLAAQFGCQVAAAEDNPSLKEHNTILVVVPNVGDEELPQPMEDYLFKLTDRNKKYAICELGNYFGLENYCGCKKVVFHLLDKLGWHRLADISLDSMPTLDEEGLDRWATANAALFQDH